MPCLSCELLPLNVGDRLPLSCFSQVVSHCDEKSNEMVPEVGLCCNKPTVGLSELVCGKNVGKFEATG